MGFQPIILSGFTVGGSSGGGGGSGTVTSVALSLPTSVFTISGSPVTTTGTLTGTFHTQNANTVFAGPASGAAAAPTFRSLVAADINGLITPGGTSGQVQYNNSGALGGFGSWNGTTLAITGAISSTTTMAVGTNLHVFGTSIMAGDMVVQGGANFSGNLGFYGASEISQPSGNIITALSNLGLVTGGTLASGNIPNNAANTTGTASNITATANSTLTTLSALSLPYSQVTGGPSTNAITALTGDITASGPGSVAASLVATSNSTLTTLSSLSLPGSQVTGNITGSSGSVSGTNVITNTNLAQMTADTLKGNNTGSTANAVDLSVSQVQTMLGIIPSSSGDLSQATFTAADNQSSPANITGFTFANASVRSFDATVSIVRNGTYAAYKLYGIQKGSSWAMSEAYTGDVTGITFSITTAGQIQYTSTSTGFTSQVQYRAIITSV